MVNSPTRFSDWLSQYCCFVWPYSLFYSGFLSIGKLWSCCCLSFYWLPFKLFHHTAYDYSHANWDGFCDKLRDVSWKDVFKHTASAADTQFCKWWAQFGIDVYIPYDKYQVKPHLSLWFSAAFTAALAHRNHFFCWYQQSKSPASKVMFKQISNHCLLKLPNLLILIKQQSVPLLRNLAHMTFGKLLIVFSAKARLL